MEDWKELSFILLFVTGTNYLPKSLFGLRESGFSRRVNERALAANGFPAEVCPDSAHNSVYLQHIIVWK